jgi:antitoxin component YwqK of YwqJK toxin-antitoxin module
VVVVLASGAAGAYSGGLAQVSSPCPSGQELREERYGPTSIKARGCVGTDSENTSRRQGRWEFFHPNGQKEAEGSYVDGLQGGETGTPGILIDGREGAWAFWYEDGQKKQESTYRDGQREGVATEWHANGQQKAEFTYRDGQLEGLMTQWHENGHKELETTYLNGTSTSATAWDENGNQIRAD